MRPQVLSALLTTVLGAGAMFTLYPNLSRYCKRTHVTPVFVTAMLVGGRILSSVTISAANWQIVQLTAR